MLDRALVIAMTLAFGSWIGADAALAENRIALVIGNSTYQSVTPLPNPANDAKAMAELLTAAGFEVVAAPDLTQSAMRRAIGDFAEKAAAKGPDTVALVFYGGHGVQVDGENYLIPIDARIQREADVPLQAVRLADLMNALSSVPSKTRIVILDACRNNPFSEINKTTGRGLAIVDAPTGSIVSYSTAPGSEAEDGTGANSPYTTALLAVAKEPGVPIEQAFKRVRYSVHQSTKGGQTPWESSSLTGEFSFFPGAAGTGAPPPPPAAQKVAAATPRTVTRTVESWRKELQPRPAAEAYQIVIREDTVEAYQAYLLLYGAQPAATPVRDLLGRRRVMIAWYVAVTVNTPWSYAAFLSDYPNADLAFSAQRLQERAQGRSLLPETRLASACVCAPSAPAETRPTRTRRTKSKQIETERETKVAPTTRTRARRVIVEDEPPPRVVPVGPAGPPVGIGIGIGRIPIGPGGGSRGPSGPSGPSGPTGPVGTGNAPRGGPMIGPR
jgi:uncharacterized caspase-like protein